MNVLAELRTPGPVTTALTRPFWDAAATGRLLVQCCEACGKAVLYPRGICPHCWSPKLAWQEASGRGRLKSFSVVHKPGHPAWLPAAPYVVGLVELAEGPTMTSLILSGGEPVVGAPVLMRATDVGGRVIPAFEIELSGSSRDG